MNKLILSQIFDYDHGHTTTL